MFNSKRAVYCEAYLLMRRVFGRTMKRLDNRLPEALFVRAVLLKGYQGTDPKYTADTITGTVYAAS